MARKPILGVDVWEHSYYIDYRNRRPDYLKAWVDHLINWEYVAELFGAEVSLRRRPSARAGGRGVSVGQVQRLLRADVDVGRVHRLTVGEGSVQVDAAIEGPRQLRRRLFAGFQRAQHLLPARRAALGRLKLNEIGLA